MLWGSGVEQKNKSKKRRTFTEGTNPLKVIREPIVDGRGVGSAVSLSRLVLFVSWVCLPCIFVVAMMKRVPLWFMFILSWAGDRGEFFFILVYLSHCSCFCLFSCIGCMFFSLHRVFMIFCVHGVFMECNPQWLQGFFAKIFVWDVLHNHFVNIWFIFGAFDSGSVWYCRTNWLCNKKCFMDFCRIVS